MLTFLLELELHVGESDRKNDLFIGRLCSHGHNISLSGRTFHIEKLKFYLNISNTREIKNQRGFLFDFFIFFGGADFFINDTELRLLGVSAP